LEACRFECTALDGLALADILIFPCAIFFILRRYRLFQELVRSPVRMFRLWRDG
jgi:hypothetical protein